VRSVILAAEENKLLSGKAYFDSEEEKFRFDLPREICLEVCDGDVDPVLCLLCC
jgi:hypothetical protein